MSFEPAKHYVRLPGGDPLSAAIEDVDALSVTVALLARHQPLSLFRDRHDTVRVHHSPGACTECRVVREAPGDRLAQPVAAASARGDSELRDESVVGRTLFG